MIGLRNPSSAVAASAARGLLYGIVPLVGALTAAGCDESARTRGEGDTVGTTSKFVAVFVDRSLSVDRDTALYARSLRRVVASIREGDRIVIAPITAASGRDFAVSIDHTVPPPFRKPGWMEEPARYRRALRAHEDSVAAVREQLERDVESFLAQSPSTHKTSILEALRVVASMFQIEHRRKVLVILSDMLEDSQVANFWRMPPDEELTRRLIERSRAAGTLPDLSGVSVYVGGALATPPAHAAAVERFWRTYFEATGAVIGTGWYQRVLAGVPE